MPGAGRRGLRRRAVADHDVAGLQLGAAQRLAQFAGAGAQLLPRSPAAPPTSAPRSCRRSARPAHARDRPARRRARTARARPAWRPRRLVAAAVARNLELRHRRALRRHERNLEIPARRARYRSVAAGGRRGPAARPPAAGSAARSRHRYRRADDARSQRAAHPVRSTARRSAAASAARRETAAAGARRRRRTACPLGVRPCRARHDCRAFAAGFLHASLAGRARGRACASWSAAPRACGAAASDVRQSQSPRRYWRCAALAAIRDLVYVGCGQCGLQGSRPPSCGVATVPACDSGVAGAVSAHVGAERGCSVWRSTISAAFRSGIVPDGRRRARGQRGLEQQPGFLKRGLDVAAVEVRCRGWSAAPAPARSPAAASAADCCR